MIRGLNNKEQTCLDILKDGKIHTLSEMRKQFIGEIKSSKKAHSHARNSIRKLIRDGWIKRAASGTYKLTEAGKKWIKLERKTTVSYKNKAKPNRVKTLKRCHKRLAEIRANKEKRRKDKRKQIVMISKMLEIRIRIAKQSIIDKAEEISEKIVDNDEEYRDDGDLL